ncbi:archaellin/type IV pilin N-terminal domain-containing protein [Nanoarchaeota archaeon]
MNKKGLTPLAATILLVVLAIIAIGLIFVWVSTLKTEQIHKFGLPIEEQCDKISFVSLLSGNKIMVNNTGELIIYGINLEIDKDNRNINKFLRTRDGTISPNENEEVVVPVSDVSGKINKMLVTPVLLGKGSTTGLEKLHSCSNKAQNLV